MKLNNSIKLSLANFSLFWGILIYKIIAVAISFLLFLPVMNAVITNLSSAGFGGAINSLLQSPILQNLSVSCEKLHTCFATFFEGMGLLATNNTFVFVYLILLLAFIVPFLLKLGDVPASESVYSYMASLNKNHYASNFITNIKKSMGYSILKTLIEFPFWAIIVWGAYGILTLAVQNINISIIFAFILFAFIVLMFSLKISILNGWAPSIVAFKQCAGKAFKKGTKSVKRNFWSTVSSFSMVMVVIVAIIGTFGVFSVPVLIPLLELVIVVFGQVLFFESQGMNYYISLDKIIKPRKLEEADKIKKVKLII